MKMITQRMAAMQRLHVLFAVDGELKKVLRKCLARMRWAERMGKWQVDSERSLMAPHQDPATDGSTGRFGKNFQCRA